MGTSFPIRPERLVRVPSFIRGPLWVVYHKKHLYLNNISLGKVLNLMKLLYAYLMKKQRVQAYPVMLKMDVTPLCQLKCDICIHARSFEPKQALNSSMKMSMELFKKVCDEVSGKTMVLSLHYLGEPLLNENLAEMIRYATNKKLNTYFTTNFSLSLSDLQLRELVESGLGTLIVAMDGFSQETYGQTRIRGDISLVKENLRRFIEIRNRLHRMLPFVMVQSLLFEHNQHEKEKVEGFCRGVGVDSLAFSPGDTISWKVQYSPRFTPRPPRRLPLCMWPYFSSVILCDGDVIPCCFYRLEENYAEDIPRISMGNLWGKKILEIFNGPGYQLSRRLSSKPEDTPETSGSFCYRCRYLFV